MLKKMSIAFFVGAISLAAVPAFTSAALAQGTGAEPPKAPTPDEAKGGGAMKKGGAMMKKSGGGAMMKKSGGGAMMKKK